MGIGNDEWNAYMWRGAATATGKRHRKALAALHYAPHAVGLTLLAFGGWALWWTWGRLSDAWAVRGELAVPVSHGVPLWLWVVLALLVLVTGAAFRPGRGVDFLGVLLLKVVVLGGAWLAAIGALAGFLL